ncbi:MAG: carbohydrate ABC transporter substrate-binding protein, partial [Lachnospiraceae bacterium]|nr:carbohydrate ABC transporter substrate-binding protein [Lachnospiraceae bacterium]
GLCTGTENFVCINAEASADDQAASAYFLEWLYTSDAGKEFVATNYGVAPFEGFDNSVASDANPLIKFMLDDMENKDTEYVTWVTVTTPSQDWKDVLGENLLSYAEGGMDWDDVVSETVDKWKAEKAAANE